MGLYLCTYAQTIPPVIHALIIAHQHPIGCDYYCGKIGMTFIDKYCLIPVIKLHTIPKSLLFAGLVEIISKSKHRSY